MKQIVKIIEVTVAVKKDGQSTYNKLNKKFFVWDEDLAQRLKAAIGQTLELEISEGNFPKVVSIYGVSTEPAIEVVNMTGAPKVASHMVGAHIKRDLAEEIIVKKDQQNSRSFGKGADSIKLYFNTAQDLDRQIIELIAKDLMPADYKRNGEEDLPKEPTSA